MSEFVKVLLGDQGTFEDVYQECPVFDDGKYCGQYGGQKQQ